MMKKTVLWLVLISAVLILSGCRGSETPVGVQVDESGNIITVDPEILSPSDSDTTSGDHHQNASKSWPESSYKPLISGKDGVYCGGFLYYKDDATPYLRYVDFMTEKDEICCFDPLCKHGVIASGGIDSGAYCTALVQGSSILARTENGHNIIYYIKCHLGDNVLKYTLNRLDTNENQLSVIADIGEFLPYNMWFYGDDILMSLSEKTGDTLTTGIYCVNKNGKTLLIPKNAELIGSDKRGLLWRFGNCVYLTSSDYSATAVLLDDYRGQNAFFYNGYIYYFEPSGDPSSKIVVNYEPYIGEYDENWSSGNSGSASFFPKCWYRIKIERDAKPELVYENAELRWKDTFYADIENGVLYLTPLEPAFIGFLTQTDDASPDAMAQLGMNGKPILDTRFKRTAGKVIALDLNTLTAKEVFSGLDGDVYSMYGISDGKLAVRVIVEDLEEITAFMEKEPPHSNRCDYFRYSFLDLK